MLLKKALLNKTLTQFFLFAFKLYFLFWFSLNIFTYKNISLVQPVYNVELTKGKNKYLNKKNQS